VIKKRKVLILLLIISIVSLSSCEGYNVDENISQDKTPSIGEIGDAEFDLNKIPPTSMEDLYEIVHNEYYLLDELCYISELKGLISMLVAERHAAHPQGVDFTLYENLHLHLDYGHTPDARFILLREFDTFLFEASIIHDRARGIDEERIIISMFGILEEIDKFFIVFTSEEYLGLVDFLLDFTGISKEELEVSIRDPIDLRHLGQLLIN